ncbi:hypothetical protein KKA47_07565, partial [bacterium]|nr:hypothetical protein [bacterium]
DNATIDYTGKTLLLYIKTPVTKYPFSEDEQIKIDAMSIEKADEYVEKHVTQMISDELNTVEDDLTFVQKNLERYKDMAKGVYDKLEGERNLQFEAENKELENEINGAYESNDSNKTIAEQRLETFRQSDDAIQTMLNREEFLALLKSEGVVPQDQVELSDDEYREKVNNYMLMRHGVLKPYIDKFEHDYTYVIIGQAKAGQPVYISAAKENEKTLPHLREMYLHHLCLKTQANFEDLQSKVDIELKNSAEFSELVHEDRRYKMAYRIIEDMVVKSHAAKKEEINSVYEEKRAKLEEFDAQKKEELLLGCGDAINAVDNYVVNKSADGLGGDYQPVLDAILGDVREITFLKRLVRDNLFKDIKVKIFTYAPDSASEEEESAQAKINDEFVFTLLDPKSKLNREDVNEFDDFYKGCAYPVQFDYVKNDIYNHFLSHPDKFEFETIEAEGDTIVVDVALADGVYLEDALEAASDELITELEKSACYYHSSGNIEVNLRVPEGWRGEDVNYDDKLVASFEKAFSNPNAPVKVNLTYDNTIRVIPLVEKIEESENGFVLGAYDNLDLNNSDRIIIPTLRVLEKAREFIDPDQISKYQVGLIYEIPSRNAYGKNISAYKMKFDELFAAKDKLGTHWKDTQIAVIDSEYKTQLEDIFSNIDDKYNVVISEKRDAIRKYGPNIAEETIVNLGLTDAYKLAMEETKTKYAKRLEEDLSELKETHDESLVALEGEKEIAERTAENKKEYNASKTQWKTENDKSMAAELGSLPYTFLRQQGQYGAYDEKKKAYEAKEDKEIDEMGEKREVEKKEKTKLFWKDVKKEREDKIAALDKEFPSYIQLEATTNDNIELPRITAVYMDMEKTEKLNAKTLHEKYQELVDNGKMLMTQAMR